MNAEPDRARAAIADAGITGEAVNLLSADAYGGVSFEDLASLKGLLKVFFSHEPWTATHEKRLAELLGDVGGVWTHTLSNGATVEHGMIDGRYRLRVTGGEEQSPGSLFNRLFSGPIIPEATPNPRHIRFPLGGRPGPSRFYRRGEAIDDDRVTELLTDPAVSDVLVAPDFVAIGLDRADRWEDRIDEVLASVTRLFGVRPPVTDSTSPTRDELVAGGGRPRHPSGVVDLHLLDPDSDAGRKQLVQASRSTDPRRRRLAVATIGNTGDDQFLQSTLVRVWDDPSRIVRRTAVDVAVDTAQSWIRPLLERGLTDPDAWIRWKSLRGLVDIGSEPSLGLIEPLRDDADFRVRLEAHNSFHSAAADKLDRVRIEIAPTHEAASEQAALNIADALIGVAHDPLLGLAGGSTPLAAYEKLARLDVDWSRVIGFLGDERWVPPDHPDSNARMVRKSALGGTQCNLLAVPFGDDPHAAAAAYEEQLAAAADGTDPAVLLLGMGDDGHTASLFPGTTALDASGRDYVATWVETKNSWRLTVTLDFISRVDHVMFLVTGAAKAARVAEVLQTDSDLPAARATRVAPQVTWFLDEHAAARLER